MAKITRAFQKIFGSTAAVNTIAKFGSLFAGSPSFTTDPTVIQSLSNYLTGWFGALIDGNAMAVEDRNAIDFLYARQLAYLFQAGIAEWDSSTTYYIGSMASDGLGKFYYSIIDDNLNNALTQPSKWALITADSNQTSASTTITLTNSSPALTIANHSAAQTVVLPSTTLCTIGQKFKVFSLNTTSGVGKVTIQTAGSVVLTSLSNGFGVEFEVVKNTVDGSASWLQIGNNTEIIELDGSAGISVGTSNINHDIATLALPPGSFEISITSMGQANGATTWTRFYTSLCTVSGDNFTGAAAAKEYVLVQGTLGTSDAVTSSLNFKKTQATATNYFFKFQAVFGGGGPPTGYYYVKAKRIY